MAAVETWKKNLEKLARVEDNIADLSKKLKDLQTQAEDLREDLTEELEPGTYKFKKLVLNIEEVIKKGRKSTSWKKVSEGLNHAVDAVHDTLVKKHPDWEKPLRNMSRRLHKAYQAEVEDNTSQSPDKTEITVKVLRLD